eukprot:gene13614-16570_t
MSTEMDAQNAVNNPNKYISSDTYPYRRLSKGSKSLMGIGAGFVFASLYNVVSKKPVFYRPHVHLVSMVLFGYISYKTYDTQEYLFRKNLQVLSLHQERVREQEAIRT